MTVSAAASAASAVPAMSEAAATQALIQQIASEARSSGQGLTYDPEAPVSDGQGGDAVVPGKAGKPGGKPPGKVPPKPQRGLLDEAESNEIDDVDAASDEESPDDTGEESPSDTAPGELNVAGISAALTAEGGVDVVALADALGLEPEQLKLSPGAHKAVRLERRKAQQTLERAHTLAQKLQKQYGDQVSARKAAAEGKLDPAIEFIEATFGMPWNDLNKAVGMLLQGKPIPDIESKRELRELKKAEADRVAEATKQKETAAVAEKTEQAKLWIANQIKGDKLASPEFNKLLEAAGYPTVTELVFEEMQRGYSKGLTDPKKALEKVRVKLTKQAKALGSAGLLQLPKERKPAVSASPPRAGAQTGAAGNAREMTDAELRKAVLREAGIRT